MQTPSFRILSLKVNKPELKAKRRQPIESSQVPNGMTATAHTSTRLPMIGVKIESRPGASGICKLATLIPHEPMQFKQRLNKLYK